jgi:magnesium-transporting ATPase (P-type)
VQFITQENKIVKYYSTTFLTPCPYQIGQQVKIKYMPENPQEAILDWKDGWILSIAFGIFGLVICLITYSILLPQLFRFLLGLLYQ